MMFLCVMTCKGFVSMDDVLCVMTCKGFVSVDDVFVCDDM